MIDDSSGCRWPRSQVLCVPLQLDTVIQEHQNLDAGGDWGMGLIGKSGETVVEI